VLSSKLIVEQYNGVDNLLKKLYTDPKVSSPPSSLSYRLESKDLPKISPRGKTCKSLLSLSLLSSPMALLGWAMAWESMGKE
jgi:hypothetical protein